MIHTIWDDQPGYYFCIARKMKGGAWRDHFLVAVTVEELNGSAASALVSEGHASWA